MASTGRHVDEIIQANGGTQLFAKIRADLLDDVEGQGARMIIDTTNLSPADAYRRVRSALGG